MAILLRWLQQARQLAQRGQGLVEYTLIVALVALVALAAVSTLGQTIVNKLFTLAGSF